MISFFGAVDSEDAELAALGAAEADGFFHASAVSEGAAEEAGADDAGAPPHAVSTIAAAQSRHAKFFMRNFIFLLPFLIK